MKSFMLSIQDLDDMDATADECSLAEFVEANTDADFAAVRALEVGKSYVMGEGAAPA